ncbi:MAG: hypothetical protein LBL46_00680 [Rickettsiales bacterium]|jgi:hypothetical protein|nr:hypothetical protein [Rickettsiales bacterium]
MENNIIPEKFANADGTLNGEALLKSYGELEKKIGTMINVPGAGADDASREKFLRAIGVPESADDYEIAPMFADAPDIRLRFREMGLTATQAAGVCKIAEEMLAPAIGGISESREMAALSDFFGGEEKTAAAMKDIAAYAEKKLDPAARETLASTAAGIRTIYNMMKADEPGLATGGPAGDGPNEDDLRRMMRDPKYWRDNDAEYVRAIESGFRKLYA